VAIDDRRLAETIEYVAIRRLQDRYADIVNRRTWQELHEVMRPGCRLTLDLGDTEKAFDGPAAIGDFIGTQLEQFSFFEFVILNTVVHVDVDAGSAGARTYMQELRQNVDDGRRTNAFGVYQDGFERDPDGRWWFARRRYNSYSRTQVQGPEHEQVVFDVPVVPLDEL
jgi:hypothetical protein